MGEIWGRYGGDIEGDAELQQAAMMLDLTLTLALTLTLTPIPNPSPNPNPNPNPTPDQAEMVLNKERAHADHWKAQVRTGGG